MIFGDELCKLYDRDTVTVGNVNYEIQTNHGKQNELDVFLSLRSKSRDKSFPLVFYVTDRVEDKNYRSTSSGNIVIMVETRTDMAGKQRTSLTYPIIEAIYDHVIKKIEKSRKFRVMGDRRTSKSYDDFPNYGISQGNIGSAKSSQSTVKNYIDARVVNVTLDYYKHH